ncbi:hypothetical protein AN964_02235 [Heyndrickxia shackletonii]|uniref:DUF3188 domain-containing protein n=2 Tax=Heyndrickxia shackletonii TaxID=157838 RepID=A0A0Q3WVP1_9BACI|nr:hypothetical protein AN964_02235 [Heyndrickxia shackletonii]RTZ57155.1 DUF3188 domain-containing protein [Bacillus sp. SAJ1]
MKRMNTMVKNGLFLASIGCILLLISANARTGEYNIFNLTTALFLIIVGAFMVFREKRKIKKKKD